MPTKAERVTFKTFKLHHLTPSMLKSIQDIEGVGLATFSGATLYIDVELQADNRRILILKNELKKFNTV